MPLGRSNLRGPDNASANDIRGQLPLNNGTTSACKLRFLAVPILVQPTWEAHFLSCFPSTRLRHNSGRHGALSQCEQLVSSIPGYHAASCQRFPLIYFTAFAAENFLEYYSLIWPTTQHELKRPLGLWCPIILPRWPSTHSLQSTNFVSPSSGVVLRSILPFNAYIMHSTFIVPTIQTPLPYRMG
jgi:hypothetical protein